MEIPNENIKAQDWESLVDRFLETKGNMAEFCRQNNLEYDNFRTYKIRLEAKRLRKARAGFAKIETAASAPVIKQTKTAVQLPDPEWLAVFVRNFLGLK
jgi:hypothetical protein